MKIYTSNWGNMEKSSSISKQQQTEDATSKYDIPLY